MKEGNVSVLLSRDLYFLKADTNPFGNYGSCSVHGQMEYHLYFRNFIYPFEENYDVACICEYGKQTDAFWHFDGACDKEEFHLTVEVYSAFGKLLARKDVTVHIVSDVGKEISLMCIGDSMTRAGVYLNQMASWLPSVKTVGLKCIDGVNFDEGRGGWRSDHFFETSSGEDGVSPFLFPKSVEGSKYLGDAVFWKRAAIDDPGNYCCVGMQKAAAFFGMTAFDEEGFPVNASEGDVVNCHGLFRKCGDKWVPFEDEYEFDFTKYAERNKAFFGVEKIDAVSVLLGTNDLFFVTYDEIDAKVAEMLDRYEKLIASVKACDPETKVILNLPILGAGCGTIPAYRPSGNSVKRQRFNVLSFCEGLLEKWDNEEARAKGIYICPMMNCLDMDNSFGKEYIRKTGYSDEHMQVISNWIHPSNDGYKQMGDILAGVVARLMQ